MVYLGSSSQHRGDFMYQDYYKYLQWLQNYIQAQEKRIIALENTINQLELEMKALKDKPSIHVDKIEYKFDQLKVETLDGTLNIGLNPSDLQGIEDFSVQNQAIHTPLSPKDQMQRVMEIEEAIHEYFESDLPTVITATQKRLNIQSSESYLSFIKEDIKKQLPARIESHLKTLAANDRSEENAKATNEKIIELLKKEIQNGVNIFFNHLPDNVKGMKQE